MLYHHHGTMFRENPREHLAYARKHDWESAVSTIDLLRPAPDQLTWLPAAYNLHELAVLRSATGGRMTAWCGSRMRRPTAPSRAPMR